MPVFRTEHAIPGLADNHLRAVSAALAETGRRLRLKGRDVTLLHCDYAGHWLICRFNAGSTADVRAAIDLAQLPLPAIIQVEPEFL